MAISNATEASAGPCAGAGCQTGAGSFLAVEDYLDILWVLLCTFMVLSMQFGFAMLEVGSCRKAHRMTVLTKNIMDSAVSCFAFWAYCHLGAAPSIVVGSDSTGSIQNHLLLFHFAFCATSVTICSGAMAERTHMVAYIFYSIVMAGWIYPTVACAAWGDGTSLLSGEFHDRFHQGYRYHDAAGSGVVHLVGGCSAIVGNALLGRRILRAVPEGEPEEHESDMERAGRTRQTYVPARQQQQHRQLKDGPRWDALEEEPCVRPEGGWPRRFDNRLRDMEEFMPVHYLQAMGMFTLWIGWYGFNCGSTLSMDRAGSHAAGVMAWNSTLAASAGGLGSALYCYLFKQYLDVGHMCNGTISGLVAITASCDVATEGVSSLIGLVAGLLIYPWSNNLLQCLKMDDPPCAIAVHAFCGLFGVLAAGICQPNCADLARIGGGQAEQARFCLPGHDWRPQLLAQAWGALTLIWWTVSISLALWCIFAISEVSSSLEAIELQELDEYLQKVLDQRSAGIVGHEVSGGAALRPGCLPACSSAVRKAMQDHGWKKSAGQPLVDVSGLRTKLRRFCEQSVDTALEIEHWPVLRGIARLLRCIPIVRHLAMLRLRIAPSAELSGLGHANANGGKLFKALQVALFMQEEDQKSTAQLEHKVRELAQIVQSQDAVLQAARRPPLPRSPSSDSVCGGGHAPGSTPSTVSVPFRGGGNRRGDETPVSAWSESISERSEILGMGNLSNETVQRLAEQVSSAITANREFIAAIMAQAPPSSSSAAPQQQRRQDGVQVDVI